MNSAWRGAIRCPIADAPKKPKDGACASATARPPSAGLNPPLDEVSPAADSSSPTFGGYRRTGPAISPSRRWPRTPRSDTSACTHRRDCSHLQRSLSCHVVAPIVLGTPFRACGGFWAASPPFPERRRSAPGPVPYRPCQRRACSSCRRPTRSLGRTPRSTSAGSFCERQTGHRRGRDLRLPRRLHARDHATCRRRILARRRRHGRRSPSRRGDKRNQPLTQRGIRSGSPYRGRLQGKRARSPKEAGPSAEALEGELTINPCRPAWRPACRATAENWRPARPRPPWPPSCRAPGSCRARARPPRSTRST